MKTKKKSQKPDRQSLAIALLGVIAIINGAFTIYLLNKDNAPKYDSFKVDYLIVEAVNHLNKPLPIEAESGKAYIASARLTLPARDAATDVLGDVLYRHTPGDQEEISLASKNDVDVATTALFAKPANGTTEGISPGVPKLQACARGITISYKTDSNQAVAATKKLSNGKTIYFHTETSCPNQQLLDYAKQIDNY